MNIKLTNINANPQQPRQVFSIDGLIDLAHSIKTNGLIQPIVVEKNGNGYIIHDGERRFRASCILAIANKAEPKIEISREPDSKFYELSKNIASIALAEIKEQYINNLPDTVSCTIGDNATKIDLLTRALVANIQRNDLTPIEIAESINDLITEGLHPTEIGDRLGMSRSSVLNLHSLLNLPDEVKLKVANKSLSLRKALPLASFYQFDSDIQEKLKNHPPLLSAVVYPENHDMASIRVALSDSIQEKLNPLDKNKFIPTNKYTANGNNNGNSPIVQDTCVNCHYIITHNKGKFCSNDPCFEAKTNAHIYQTLQTTQDYINVPIAINKSTNITLFFNNSHFATNAIKHALKEKCKCLHLCPASAQQHYPTSTPPHITTDPDHPNILPGSYVCVHQNNMANCQCLNDSTKAQIKKLEANEIEKEQAFNTFSLEIEPELKEMPYHVIALIYWILSPFYESKTNEFTKMLLTDPLETRSLLNKKLTEIYKSRHYNINNTPSQIEAEIYQFLNSIRFKNSKNKIGDERCKSCGINTKNIGTKLFTVDISKSTKKNNPFDNTVPASTFIVCQTCLIDQPQKVQQLVDAQQKYYYGEVKSSDTNIKENTA